MSRVIRILDGQRIDYDGILRYISISSDSKHTIGSRAASIKNTYNVYVGDKPVLKTIHKYSFENQLFNDAAELGILFEDIDFEVGKFNVYKGDIIKVIGDSNFTTGPNRNGFFTIVDEIINHNEFTKSKLVPIRFEIDKTFYTYENIILKDSYRVDFDGVLKKVIIFSDYYRYGSRLFGFTMSHNNKVIIGNTGYKYEIPRFIIPFPLYPSYVSYYIGEVFGSCIGGGVITTGKIYKINIDERVYDGDTIDIQIHSPQPLVFVTPPVHEVIRYYVLLNFIY